MKPDDLARLSPIASWRLPEADADPQETREWLDALDAVIEESSPERATFLLQKLVRVEELQLFCVFSSVAGRYGNSGQLDYATAKTGKWHVTAARGSLPVTAKSLLLSGDVRVTGQRPQGEAVISTDLLAYDTDTSVVQTAEPVSIQLGPHRLEGRGLYVVLNDGTLRLESDVHGRFVP